MELYCPTESQTAHLRERVRAVYAELTRNPDGDFHFHHGPRYAREVLLYAREELEALPAETTASFAGVGNPLRIGPIEEGATVLDIGSGSGTDLLLAARRVGPTGRAIGVDMTPEMRARAAAAADAMGMSDRVELRAGLAEELPVEDESIDVVISNGVLNLAVDKPKAFSEVRRVLRPGGRLYLADVATAIPFGPDAREDIDLWAA